MFEYETILNEERKLSFLFRHENDCWTAGKKHACIDFIGRSSFDDSLWPWPSSDTRYHLHHIHEMIECFYLICTTQLRCWGILNSLNTCSSIYETNCIATVFDNLFVCIEKLVCIFWNTFIVFQKSFDDSELQFMFSD